MSNQPDKPEEPTPCVYQRTNGHHWCFLRGRGPEGKIGVCAKGICTKRCRHYVGAVAKKAASGVLPTERIRWDEPICTQRPDLSRSKTLTWRFAWALAKSTGVSQVAEKMRCDPKTLVYNINKRIKAAALGRGNNEVTTVGGQVHRFDGKRWASADPNGHGKRRDPRTLRFQHV